MIKIQFKFEGNDGFIDRYSCINPVDGVKLNIGFITGVAKELKAKSILKYALKDKFMRWVDENVEVNI